MSKKVLVLEDEENIRSFVVFNLKKSDYETVEFGNGNDAIQYMQENSDVAIAILDVMLPDISGFDVCRRIRAMGKRTGIITLKDIFATVPTKRPSERTGTRSSPKRNSIISSRPKFFRISRRTPTF